jgi:hypothetical protein
MVHAIVSKVCPLSREWKAATNRYLSSHLGVISTTQLLKIGCPSRTLANLVADGELVTMLPGVFRSAQWPIGRDQLLAQCARETLRR